jgi:hypothetical protein
MEIVTEAPLLRFKNIMMNITFTGIENGDFIVPEINFYGIMLGIVVESNLTPEDKSSERLILNSIQDVSIISMTASKITKDS